MDIRNLDEVPAFTTKDGSEIRELLAHRNSCIRLQSLAEARLEPGCRTAAHYHPKTEEIYYILSGGGLMQVGEQRQTVSPGDAIAIPPGAVHTIRNTGTGTLRFLCCCAPAYEDSDTVMVEKTQ
ncbi:MAG TPA: cupin domain-containing protein [Pirellulales bacterium]|jgi:mannose-6-phosphate isomerase-like protein (cupin superfamily)|nr:cupin domain-containing protein [Pirellulales bacterium]